MEDGSVLEIIDNVYWSSVLPFVFPSAVEGVSSWGVYIQSAWIYTRCLRNSAGNPVVGTRLFFLEDQEADVEAN